MYINANNIYFAKMHEISNKIDSVLQKANGFSNFGQVLAGVQKTSATASVQAGFSASTQDMTASQLDTASQNLAGSKTDYDAIISQKSSQYGVNENLVKAVIEAESDYHASSVSSCGAIGLMQLMPSTAKSLGVSNPYDPAENIDGGIRYLKDKLDSYHGNIKMALAAYNCGPGKLNSLHITNIDDPVQFARLPSETQNYVNKIMKNLYQQGGSI